MMTILILGILLLAHVVNGQIYGSHETFTIGGLFNLFSSTGVVNHAQLEQVHAFMLAVNEINNDRVSYPNITLNYLIRNVYSYSSTEKVALFMAESGYPLLGVVNALNNDDTIAGHLSFNEYMILMADSVANSPTLGDSSIFPFRAQTSPLESFEGAVLKNVVCSYGLTRIVTFCQESDSYLRSIYNFYKATSCNLDILGSFSFQSSVTDFTSLIKTALVTKGTAFVLFMDSAHAAHLIEQGHSLGLFRQGTQLFGDSSVISETTLQSFSVNTDVATVMKGMLGVEFWPNYNQWRSDKGHQFAEAWRSQSNTINNCAGIKDISNHSFLNNSGHDNLCYGLDFSGSFYDANATELNAYTILTYDATILLGKALQLMANDPYVNTYNGVTLSTQLFNMQPFEGASGTVNITSGTIGTYGRGDRQGGLHYRLMNFNYDAYINVSRRSYVPSHEWDEHNGIHECPLDQLCYPITYNTKYNLPIDGFPPYVLSQAPSVVKIGGLFSIFNSDGSVDISQVEHLAAFVMALEEINNKTDNIADNLLPHTQLVYQLETGDDYYDTVVSSQTLLNGFLNTGVIGVIGALQDEETIAANQMLSQGEVMEIHSVAMSSDLGNGDNFKFKAQTCPIKSYEGMVLQSLMCDPTFLNFRRVAVFVTGDKLGYDTVFELQDLTYCELTYLTEIYFSSTAEDFSSQIADAKATGALVFVLFTTPRNTAMLLEQGHAAGLFHENTQVLLTSTAISGNFFESFSSSADIPSILQGAISLEYYPTYSLQRTTVGRRYMERWRQRSYTGQYIDSRGLSHCNTHMDDAEVSYLYRNLAGTACAGLNFSSYDSTLSAMDNHVPLTYDATYVLAHGIDVVINSGQALTGANLRRAIFDNVTFRGASGLVDIFEGKADSSHYGQGDREVGQVYKALNFNLDSYLVNYTNSFQPALLWSSENMTMTCDEYIVCVNAAYRTADNHIPNDTPLPILVTLGESESSVLIALACIIWLSTIAFAVLLWHYRLKKLIKMSQPVMLQTVLFGGIVAGFRVLNSTFPITTTTCVTGLWFGHMAFVLVFGGLFLKTWRVYTLVVTTFKRIKITNRQITRLMLQMMIASVVYMVLLTLLGKPRESLFKVEHANQETQYEICLLDYTAFHTVLFAVEAAVMVYGLKLCYAIKDLPDAINEAKYIAAVFPAVFLLGILPPTRQFVATLGIGIATLSTMYLVFLPKFYLLRSGQDADNNFKVKIASPKGIKLSRRQSAQSLETKTDGNSNGLAIPAKQALHGLKSDDRHQFIVTQIQEWQRIMMQNNVRGSSNASHGSSSLSRGGDSISRNDDMRGRVASIHPSMAPSPMERPMRGQDSNYSSNVID